MLGLGRLFQLQVLQLDHNPHLEVEEVVQALCCKAPLFDVSLLMGQESTKPITTLQAISFGLDSVQTKVRSRPSAPYTPSFRHTHILLSRVR